MRYKNTKKIIPFILAIIMVNAIALGHVFANDTNKKPYDILIKNGLIVDGSGKSGFRADVAIREGKILRIGTLKNVAAGKIIDANGMVVAPGFIDLHSHADRNILRNPHVENNIRQGITTVLAGNCGGSPLPLGSFMTSVSDKGISLNMALLVGHNTIRKSVMGKDNRTPTAAEQAEMEALMEQAMKDGAFGLSTGLKYIPGAYAKTDEVIALAKVASGLDGFYATHMREEGKLVIKSIEETLQIGAQAHIPVHISHHKVVGKTMWGTSVETLSTIDKARKEGIDVTLDQYPYTASSTTLSILFPAWSLAGGQEEIMKRLDNPKIREKIKQGIVDNIRYDRGSGDPARVFISAFAPEPSLAGKNLAEVTALKGRKITIENAAETLMDLQYAGGGRGVFHAMDEKDVTRIMKDPYVSIATDGSAVDYGESVPHPRNYGTFPRVLRKYVREDKILSLESAIHKMTGLPAQRLKLKDRGLISKNMMADIVIFDPDKINDPADWTTPHQYATGIPHVIVNGQLVINDNKRTKNFPGTILKKSIYNEY